MIIKLKKDILLNKFLTPITKVAEKCVISIYPNNIQSLVTTQDSNPILYAKINTESDIGSEKEITLNLPNVNKLTRMLNCIPSEEIELTVNSNNIEYKSLNMNFKYHLLEDGVIEKTPVNPDKIAAIKYDSDFIIERGRSSDIMKGTTFATDSSKLYFYMKDKKVYAELTDKEIANTDSVSYFITDVFSGEEIKKPLLINLEIFKMFYGISGNIITKINTKNGIILFKFEDTDYTLQYIVSTQVK